ncbi:acyl-CoA reductase-like NAD-dependent aldehyde dehydrogenase [Streptomyces glaucescens]
MADDRRPDRRPRSGGRPHPLARVPALAAEDVTRAYGHAERGFALWKRTSPFERARSMTDAALLIRERAEDIAADVTAENGKTLAEARGETLKAADFLDYYAVWPARATAPCCTTYARTAVRTPSASRSA